MSHKCMICGKELERKFLMHLERVHHIDPKTYYDTYLKTENEGICKCCGKKTEFVCNSKHWMHYNDFCSRSCVMTQIHKNIQSNPDRKSEWSNHSRETLKSMWNDPDQRDKWINMISKQMSDRTVNHYHGRRIEFDGYVFKSSWELNFYNTMNSNGIYVQYEPHTVLWCKNHRYTPDFVIPSLGKIIEIKPEHNVTYSVIKKLIIAGRKLNLDPIILTENNWNKVIDSLVSSSRSQVIGDRNVGYPGTGIETRIVR